MASFIMAGRFQAIAFVSLFALLSLGMFPVPFVLLSNAAVALVALRQGKNQGLIVALAASVILAVVTTILFQDFLVGLFFGLPQWLLMSFFAVILTRTTSWAYLLQIMLFIVVGGLILFHLSVSDPQLFWKEAITQQVDAVIKSQELPAEDVKQFTEAVNISLDIMSKWIAAIIASSLLITWIVSMIVARHWQARLYHPGGFAEEFREIRLGKVLSIIFLVTVVLFSVTDSQIVIDIIIAAMVIFLFQGLSLVHGLVKKMQMSQFWLIGMYVLLIPILPSSMVILVLLVSFGIIDNFADFRNTLITKS